MDGCGETEYREENLDDQTRIFLLESDECGEPQQPSVEAKWEDMPLHPAKCMVILHREVELSVREEKLIPSK